MKLSKYFVCTGNNIAGNYIVLTLIVLDNKASLAKKLHEIALHIRCEVKSWVTSHIIISRLRLDKITLKYLCNKQLIWYQLPIKRPWIFTMEVNINLI